MKKKFLCICTLFLALFVSACNSTDNLSAYKNNAADELLTYATEKLENEYYADQGHQEFLNIIIESIKKINASARENVIDIIKKEAKDKMDSVEPLDIIGSFYTLPQAFEQGLISHDDLEIMADYINSDTSANSEELSPKTLLAIKRNFANYYQIGIDTVSLVYYGNYNDCYAVIVDRKDAGHASVMTDVIVDEVLFEYSCEGIEIVIWKY